ncbi:hypothetical protein PISMIDRAFT_687203 [Pisolithus microcarpus 441]|uniref:Uncharacterized protein n=1 Tax=Pisolithus microcarpus 441 TaxID=765257 RepID=A0A0C9YG25_9AGAM|nr:hypothetical protein PISMIDRAFT_687203 [Pisolithus microcarpus 441]
MAHPRKRIQHMYQCPLRYTRSSQNLGYPRILTLAHTPGSPPLLRILPAKPRSHAYRFEYGSDVPCIWQ